MYSVSKDARFMRNVGLALIALTAVAFAPKYFVPLATGSYEPPSAYMHLHAISAILWMLIFAAQASLVTLSRREWHRILGYFALAVAVVNVITGVVVQLDILPASPDDFSNVVGSGFRLFHSTPAFVLFLIWALKMRRRTDWHLRLMYQTAIAAIATILGRIYLFYGLMDETLASVMIPVGNLAFVLVLPVYDRLQYGKVHRASWVGVAAFVVFQIIATPVVFSDFWTNYATGQ